MTRDEMRENIIDLLISTRTQSEGVTADAILSLFKAARAGGGVFHE